MDLLLPLDTITLGSITMIIYRKLQIFDDTAKQEREMGYMGGRGYLVGGTWRGASTR